MESTNGICRLRSHAYKLQLTNLIQSVASALQLFQRLLKNGIKNKSACFFKVKVNSKYFFLNSDIKLKQSFKTVNLSIYSVKEKKTNSGEK